jgi:hypothetical protein
MNAAVVAGRLVKEHQLGKGRKWAFARMVTRVEVLGSAKSIHSAAESLSAHR